MVRWTAEPRVSPDLFPLRRYGQFEDALNRITVDPLSALLITLAGDLPGSLIGSEQVTVRPCPPEQAPVRSQVPRDAVSGALFGTGIVTRLPRQ